ncbi:hypothetical protein NC651_037585 [Populus alba x Populus x berolinensis]|nr:hypothetical protein NC651_037585 [Populus alba x Populus x berolinensis]
MHADVTARLAGVIMHNREDPVIPIGASKWSSVDYSPSKVHTSMSSSDAKPRKPALLLISNINSRNRTSCSQQYFISEKTRITSSV